MKRPTPLRRPLVLVLGLLAAGCGRFRFETGLGSNGDAAVSDGSVADDAEAGLPPTGNLVVNGDFEEPASTVSVRRLPSIPG